MNIITLDKLSKRYRISQLGAKSLREELARLFGRSGNTGADEFFALREVSCEIEQGEAVGFIGPNGSGKSTVLKLLARIIYPTQGKLIVRGSVASLIEVGAGFHPELTGRENIFLYGSIMGRSGTHHEGHPCEATCAGERPVAPASLQVGGCRWLRRY